MRETREASDGLSEENRGWAVAYGIPMVRLDGKNLVGFGAGKGHCAFYVMSTRVPKRFPELERYDFSTSTLRFQPDDPPPASLLKRLVKARIAENKAIAEGRAADPHATRR
jgi:uncharacterized protein YdhG (YjbR/CyaY superfamily)